jgi:osmotically-inducible protein OsmY
MEALLCGMARLFRFVSPREGTMGALTSACAEPATPIPTQANLMDLAQRCWRSNPYLALKNISCDLVDGVLVLWGCLPTYYLKQIAQEVVAHLEGVERIDNQIQVVIPAFRPPQG